MRILFALLLLGAWLPANAATVPLIEQSLLARLLPAPVLHRHLAGLVTEPRSSYSITDRARFGQIYATQMGMFATRGQLNQDPGLHERLRRITGRLVAAAGAIRPEALGWPWEIHVVSDPTPFAYSFAGGKLWLSNALTTNLSDDELAAVVSHEMAHILTNLPPAQHDQARRDGEIEADVLGMILMQGAGFHPEAAINLLQRTSLAEEQLPVAVRAAHPPKRYRAYLLRALLPALAALPGGGGAPPPKN